MFKLSWTQVQTPRYYIQIKLNSARMKQEACNSQFVRIKLPKIFNSAQENCSYNFMSFIPRFRFLNTIVENK